MQVVSIDGQLKSAAEAQISVFDRGFLYGDSVFESVRTYQGHPFALDEHLARLTHSAQLVHIAVPVPMAQFKGEISHALGVADNPESYLRLMITRGEGKLGLDPALARGPRRLILVSPLEPLAPELYQAGVMVVTWRAQRHTDIAAPGAKVGNYLVSVLATHQARQQGGHEALIVNADGLVLEGASSNVFWVSAGKLHTPPVEAGILPGITRACVLRAAEALGIECSFSCPSVEQLAQADEVFISSSIRELVAVVRIDEQVVGAGRPGGMTARLHRAYAQLVQEMLRSG